MKPISLILISIAFAVVNGSVRAQTTAVIDIFVPLHGVLAFVTDDELTAVDTYTGEIFPVDELTSPGRIRYPLLSPQIGNLIYTKGGEVTLVSLEPGNVPRTLLPYDQLVGLYRALDWNGDGTQVLLHLQRSGVYDQLQILQIAEGLPLTTVLDYVPEEPLDFAPDFVFSSIVSADWNPVFGEWIAVVISGFPNEEVPPGMERFSTQWALLVNHVTGEQLLTDDLPTQTIYGATWAADGRTLAVDWRNAVAILSFNLNEGTPPTIRVSSLVEGNDLPDIIGWLGAGDLLLAMHRTPENEVEFSAALIRDSQLLTQEMFQIPASLVTSTLGRQSVSWRLTADEQERGALSCLFDETLPARLEVGVRARVTFTDGTPSRLREAPGLLGTEIAQMAEGTEFSVIGGPWCADEYRWWQLELDDGMIGWSAEGDAENYFLEPAE